MLKRLVDWLLDRLPVTRWIELLTQPEDRKEDVGACRDS